jgi:hypothetical protein
MKKYKIRPGSILWCIVGLIKIISFSALMYLSMVLWLAV